MREVAQDTSSRDRTHSSLPRAAMVLSMVGALLVVTLVYLGFLMRVGSEVEAHQGSWSDILPLDQPEFKASFWQTVRSYVWPSRTIYYLGGAYTLMFILAVGLVGWYWHRTSRKQGGSAVFLVPAIIPAVVGLALPPLTLRNVAQNTYELAELGLSNPAASGVGFGEATATVYVGTVLSLMCMLVMLWSRTKGDLERRA